MRTFVYIDGFNLYYAIRSTGCKWLNIKLLAENVLPAHAIVSCVKYYTARVSGASDPTQPARQQIYLNALATLPEVNIFYGNFLAKANWRPMLNLPVADRSLTGGTTATVLSPNNYTVAADASVPASTTEILPVSKYRNGQHSRKPTPHSGAIKAQVFSMEEKGSDVNLAVHLVHDAWKKDFDAAAIITNDTDLVEPIRIVSMELGLPVFLLTPPRGYGAASSLSSVATRVRHINVSHLRASQFPNTINAANGKVIVKPPSW